MEEGVSSERQRMEMLHPAAAAAGGCETDSGMSSEESVGSWSGDNFDSGSGSGTISPAPEALTRLTRRSTPRHSSTKSSTKSSTTSSTKSSTKSSTSISSKRTQSPPPSAGRIQQEEWECSHCTFLNTMGTLQCSMCEQSRPSSRRMKKVAPVEEGYGKSIESAESFQEETLGGFIASDSDSEGWQDGGTVSLHGRGQLVDRNISRSLEGRFNLAAARMGIPESEDDDLEVLQPVLRQPVHGNPGWPTQRLSSEGQWQSRLADSHAAVDMDPIGQFGDSDVEEGCASSPPVSSHPCLPFFSSVQDVERGISPQPGPHRPRMYNIPSYIDYRRQFSGAVILSPSMQVRVAPFVWCVSVAIAAALSPFSPSFCGKGLPL